MLELRRPRNRFSARALAASAVLFALVTWQVDFVVAIAVLAAGISGYLLQFYTLRVSIALMRRDLPDALSVGYAATGLLGSVALIYFGFALVLGLSLGLWFIVDAVVLRFA